MARPSPAIAAAWPLTAGPLQAGAVCVRDELPSPCHLVKQADSVGGVAECCIAAASLLPTALRC